MSTHVIGDPHQFSSDALAGFADLYQDRVHPVFGGVIRASYLPPEKVAVVVGGGSGHYPAFAGYVGAGIADAAAVGEVFASPSTSRIVSATKAVAGPAGAVLCFGNYAGDVLNFEAAAKELSRQGVPTRTIAVSDDIASAGPHEKDKRRGIAGNVVVFKIVGAAAEQGYSLTETARVAASANSNTRSLGVAFSGVQLPGSSEPMFTVSPDTMSVGLGIHGEAGISVHTMMSASELGEKLVNELMAAAPTNTRSKVAVVLNGLGSTKYEELFVLWRFVAPALRSQGLSLVAPECGEFVTSLDMAGCSLTLTWLDDELERLWLAPADTPAFRRGNITASSTTHRDLPKTVGPGLLSTNFATATPESQHGALRVVAVLTAVAQALAGAEEELGKLDARAGDGDHGRGMAAGSHAAAAAARAAFDQGAGAASTLRAAAEAWAERAGGTSGMLWGAGLSAAAAEFSDTETIAMDRVVRGARAALDAIVSAGGAKPGDKTLVDALAPLVASLEAQWPSSFSDVVSPTHIWQTAAAAAAAAAGKTADFTPRLGRARPLAELSMGHPDPGAVSLALAAQAAGQVSLP